MQPVVIGNATLYPGDCRDVLRTMPENSVNSVVTDPPYELGFMGKKWDATGIANDPAMWAEVLRVLKPGGHMLAFSGSRTYHRMTCAIEDAGFEIRDQIMWLYGSGFPKSHNLEGQFKGWGSALKPAHEPICMARKPLLGTVADNVQRYGTGALNIDGCRVGSEARPVMVRTKTVVSATSMSGQSTGATSSGELTSTGRWPANVIHDGSDEVVGLFPQTKDGVSSPNVSGKEAYGGGFGGRHHPGYGSSGSAARFFKCCPPDETCPLCCLPYAEACDTMTAWKNTLASIAEKRGWTSQATSEFIARVSAIGPASERIVPHVKSAGNLCDSCAISIAVALVATKTSVFSSEELQATLASTGSYSDSILIPSLASFAELWASIDTIPTTNSLSLLFGSVRDAIASSTRQDTKGKAEPRSALSRFAYVPKASKADRDEGCEGLDAVSRQTGNGNNRTRVCVSCGLTDNGSNDHSGCGGSIANAIAKPSRNHHPTVKPTALMRYLCRLVTPPGGVVLDPFTGSGSTGKAAILEGFRFIGIDMTEEYHRIAEARIKHAQRQGDLLMPPATEKENG